VKSTEGPKVRPVYLVLLIMVPALVLAVIMTVGDALRSPIERTASLEPVEHSIAGHRFIIPKAFLYSRKEHSPEIIELKGGIRMAETVPNLAPYSEERAWMYETPTNYRRVISFGIWGFKYGTGLWEPYFTPEFLATCKKERFGLRVCPHPWRRNYDIFVKIAGDRKYAWECSRPGKNVNDFCEAEFPLLD
jgi:hypothetical protein